MNLREIVYALRVVALAILILVCMIFYAFHTDQVLAGNVGIVIIIGLAILLRFLSNLQDAREEEDYQARLRRSTSRIR